MNFRQRNSDFDRKNTGKRFFFVPFFVVIFFIAIFSFSGPRDFLFQVGSPLWRVKNSIGTFFSHTFELVQSKSSLIAENTALHNQIASMQQDELISGLAKEENQDLKTILNRKSTNQKQILATVLVKPNISPYDTLIIDIGSANSVSVGNKVLADGNVFIGYISDVYANTAKVVLYSSFGEKMLVLIGKNSIEKEAEGLGGGNFSVEMPVGSNVAVGDPIVIPSISANIFGTVDKVEFKASDSVETVLFKSPMNISELTWVEVAVSNTN